MLIVFLVVSVKNRLLLMRMHIRKMCSLHLHPLGSKERFGRISEFRILMIAQSLSSNTEGLTSRGELSKGVSGTLMGVFLIFY